MRHPVDRVAVAVDAVDTIGRLRRDAVGERPLLRSLVGEAVVGRQLRRGRAEPHHGRRRSRARLGEPAPARRRRRTAGSAGRAARAARRRPWGRRTCGRSTEQEVGAELGEVDRDVPDRHARVDVDEARRARGDPRRPRPRAGASRPRGWRAARSRVRCRARTAASTSSASKRPSRFDGDHGELDLGASARVEHGRVLDGRRHDVHRPPAGAVDGPEHGGVDRLGAAGREHDLAGAGAEAGRRPAPARPPARRVSPGPRRGAVPGSAWWSRRNGSIASSAAGRSGEVDAWSR